MRGEAGDRPPLLRGRGAWALRLGGLAAWAAAAALGCSGRGREAVPALPVYPRGNEEGIVEPQRVVPVFFYRSLPAKFQLCIEVPLAKANEQPDWEGRLTRDGKSMEPRDFVPPVLTMAGTLCFEGGLPAPPRERETTTVCLDVRDRYTGRAVARSCQPLAFAPATAAQDRDRGQEVGRLYAARDKQAIDAAAARAERSGHPFHGGVLKLLAVSLCREEKTPAAFAEARRRLAALPGWMDSPAASELAATREFEGGVLELEAGTIKSAWSRFKLAEALYLRVASPYRHSAVAKLAEILSEGGSVQEAEERLRGVLEACTPKTCDPVTLLYSQGGLAWLILINPEADAARLQEGESLARKAISELRQRGETYEEANQWLNLAFLALRQERDPGEALAQASRLLSGPDVDADEGEGLRQWADLARARQALLAGEVERALALCGRLESRHSRLITAWALSCTGEAQRRRGRLDEALATFERALAFYQNADPATSGQRIPLGPGQRADVYYLAAQTAVDLGEPAQAWRFLEELDSLLAGEDEARRCTPPSWSQSLERQREELLAQILELETPTSPERRQRLEGNLAKIKEQLQEVSRQLPNCARTAPRQAAAGGPDLRAVPLPDEVLLLERDAAGRVSLARRTRLDREEIYALMDWTARALDGRGAVSDGEWRRRLLPLAEALVPPGRGGVTVFALHGPLQGAPLAALPLPGEPERWLSERTTPAVHPAIPSAPETVPAAADPLASPLFLVNPTGDLGWAERLLPAYRARFPRAVILGGREATPAAFRRFLPTATLLHVDAHGDYDAAFPELSRIRLAGGSILLGDLAAQASLPRGFVNLSGCKTGRWPVTADSGQYGLAGLFARRGAAWVVASRGDLDDRVAHAFNRAFYDGSAAGDGFAGRYAQALAALRREGIPASGWANLLLLRGAEETGAKARAGDS